MTSGKFSVVVKINIETQDSPKLKKFPAALKSEYAALIRREKKKSMS
jgi:hypothetical protein